MSPVPYRYSFPNNGARLASTDTLKLFSPPQDPADVPATPPESVTALPTPISSSDKASMTTGPSTNISAFKTINDLRARDVAQTPFQRVANTTTYAATQRHQHQSSDLPHRSNIHEPSSSADHLHNLSSSPSSPLKPTNSIRSSPPLKTVDYNQSSPDQHGAAVFTTESSASPMTPPIADDGPMSDSTFISSAPMFVGAGATAAYPKDLDVPPTLLNYSVDTVKNLSDEECRSELVLAAELLRQAVGSIDKYKGLLSQAKLQNQLLTIETHEAAQRFEVENSLVKREVERLRYEQIDHQNYLAAAAENRSDSDTYRRRLQRAKLKLKDAAREIEERDKEILRVKKRLREGRLHREALEDALLKGKDLQQVEAEHLRREDVSTPPPRTTVFDSGSSVITSTPHSVSRKDDARQKGESGLDALGFLASQALFEHNRNPPSGSASPDSRHHNKSVPALSADYPRFDTSKAGDSGTANSTGGISLPPLRLPMPTERNGIQGQGGLLSPVAFKEGPFPENGLPTGASQAMLAHTQSPEKRRHSNASTITVPSDEEGGAASRGGAGADEERRRLGSPVSKASRDGPGGDMKARQLKTTRSPRKKLSASGGSGSSSGGVTKSPISRSGSGNVSVATAAALDKSPRTPTR